MSERERERICSISSGMLFAYTSAEFDAVGALAMIVTVYVM